MLSSKKVSLNLDGYVLRYRRLGNVPSNDQARQQEQGSAVLTSPITRRKLLVGEEA